MNLESMSEEEVARSVRQASLFRLRLSQDGYAIDDYSEARVCAGPECRAELMAHGRDLNTGLRNRARVRCDKHEKEGDDDGE